MENKTSLIQGTTWYRRNGQYTYFTRNRTARQIFVLELCCTVQNEEQANKLIEELAENKIQTEYKITKGGSQYIPSNSLIVFTRFPNKELDDESEDYKKCEQNLDNLKNYIHQNGGKIDGEEEPVQSQSVKKFSLFHFFKRRTK